LSSSQKSFNARTPRLTPSQVIRRISNILAGPLAPTPSKTIHLSTIHFIPSLKGQFPPQVKAPKPVESHGNEEYRARHSQHCHILQLKETFVRSQSKCDTTKEKKMWEILTFQTMRPALWAQQSTNTSSVAGSINSPISVVFVTLQCGHSGT
jgi:hypothetical protein